MYYLIGGWILTIVGSILFAVGGFKMPITLSFFVYGAIGIAVIDVILFYLLLTNYTN